jgi:sulfatase maturation enzyme AslB (radical SAM superfamily)
MHSPRGCFYPLNALAVHPQGTQKFCLTSSLKPESNPEAFQKQCTDIHAELSRGEWPETCRSCRSKETKGLQSRRQKTWDRKLKVYGADKVEKIRTGQAAPVLRHLEVSFSNVCNLNCAMCSSEFSSSWIGDDAKAVTAGLEFRNFTQSYGKIQRFSEQRMTEILSKSQELDMIIIKGGEPTREPLCLRFLSQLSEQPREIQPIVFLQTNGTRHPKEWLPAIGRDLRLEVGFSLDGWGPVYEWIRGTNFADVMTHFLILDESSEVQSLSIDFTLSAYNAFHFPEFLAQVLELKSRLKKLKICPFFQWAQESYARVDSLRLEDRRQIAEQVRPLFNSAPDFFANFESILAVLEQEQAAESCRNDARRWIDYVSGLRGSHLYDLQPQLKASLL